MNFSKTTSYALSTLHYLAVHGESRHSAKSMHQELNIPWPYLRQLLTDLSKHGFINSTQGRTGGFQLSRPAGEITLAQIVDAVEGLAVFDACIMGFHDCPFDHTCAMHETWMSSRAKILEILHGTSLEEMLDDDLLNQIRKES
ncbi:MAG: Rrf2 family transcriptional regulator [Bacteroidales bacterium]